jgi:small-conductance mechanosensitive channel
MRHGFAAGALACVLAIAVPGCNSSGTVIPAVGSSVTGTTGRNTTGPTPTVPTATSPLTAEAQALSPQGFIPVHYIPRASESLIAYLDTIGEQYSATSPAAEVGRELPAIDAALASLDRRRSRVPEGDVRQGELSDWRQEVLRQDERLATLESRVEKRTDEIQARIDERSGLEDLWARTGEHAAASAAPAEILRRVDQVRERLEQAGESLRSQRASLLDLLVQISDRRIAAANSVRLLDASLKVEQERLFSVESVPLPSALLSTPRRTGLGGDFLEAWRDSHRAFTRFGTEAGGRLLIQATILVALLILFAMLGPVVRRRAREDESLALSAWILGRPVSAAVLITLILTFWLHPLAPRAIFRAATLLMVVPLLRLLPGLMQERLSRAMRTLAVVYVFDRFMVFVSPHSLLLRLLLLVGTAAASILLSWHLRPAGVLGRVEGRAGSWGRLAGWAALALLAASVVANVAGNVTLAVLLGRGVLLATYAGIAFYAAARILESFWLALLATPGARRLAVVSSHGEMLRVRGARLVGLTAFLLWAAAVLRIFGLWTPLVESLAAFLATPRTLGDVTVSLGSVALFAVTVAVAILIARLLRFVLDEGVLPPMGLPRGVPAAISVTTHYVVVGAGLLLAISASGVAMDRFTFLVGALGVGIGFGLQNVVNNFVSGLILLYERPVQKSDIVEVGSLLGEVQRIGVRSSTVRTYDGAEVIVPNASLISQEVVNWTLSDRTRRIEIPLGVAYGTDPGRVIELLLAAVKGRRGVLQAPQPVALFQGFGDSSLDFVVRFWTAEFDRWSQVSSDVRASIYDAVRNAGIEIPFPQRDLRVRAGSLEARPPA